MNKMLQYNNDIEMWKRVLFYIQEETIIMKIRLTDIVLLINKDLLPVIEDFQNSFLVKEETITLFKNELCKHKTLISSNEDETNMSEGVINSHINIRNEIKKIETNFNKLKFDFYTAICQF